MPELMGILHSRQNQTPEAVSYHYQRACAAGCDNGSVIVDALLSNNAPANDVSISGSSAQVSLSLIKFTLLAKACINRTRSLL